MGTDLNNSPAHDALVLAQVLLEHGAIPDALEIGPHGLTLAGELWTLATWLRDEAAAAGDADRATRAALVALRELHSLTDYQALRTVAGDRWPTLRDEVIAELRQSAARSPSGVGEIFVYEGLLDDAIAVADRAPYDYAMVEQVADAAIQTHPDWVIRMGRPAGGADHGWCAVALLPPCGCLAEAGPRGCTRRWTS